MQEFSLTRDKAAHLVNFLGIDGHHSLDLETEGDAFCTPAIGLVIGDNRSTDGYVACSDAVVCEELTDLAYFGRCVGIDLLEVVAGFDRGDGPGHLVGRDLNLGQTFDCNFPVSVGEVVETSLEEEAEDNDCGSNDACLYDSRLFHNTNIAKY